MKIGIIYCCYQTEDLVSSSLSPWIAARAARLGGHEYIICGLSVPFEGFDHTGAPKDNTRALLGMAISRGEIDHAIVRDKPMKETEARGAALKWLVEQGVDYTLMIDSDEAYSEEDILGLTAYVAQNPFIWCFRLSLRNLVFTEHQYLAQPFTPMRIHRTHLPGGYVATGFWDDNNVYFRRPWEGESGTTVRDAEGSCLTVPQTIAFPLHYTWLSTDRSRRKIAYQIARGWECSFRWDDATNSLTFNEDYYARRGLLLPEVVST